MPSPTSETSETHSIPSFNEPLLPLSLRNFQSRDSDEDKKSAISETPRRNPPKRNAAKLEYLDSIRGLAALGVIIHHAFLACGNSNLGEYVWLHEYSVISNGAFYVFVFFVLSGRVLTLGYLKSGMTESLVSGMVRRPFRLALPVIGCMVFVLLVFRSGLFQAIHYKEYTENVHPLSGWDLVDYEDSNLKRIMQEVLFMFSFNGVNPRYQGGVLWSLGLECFLSYTLYAIALITVTLDSSAPLFLIAIFLHAFLLGKTYGLFLYGFLISYLEKYGYLKNIQHPETTKQKVFATSFKLTLASLAYVIYFTPYLDWHLNWFQQYCMLTLTPEAPLKISIPATAIIILADISPIYQRVLSHPILLFMGKISFGLYLLHGPMLPVFKLFVAYGKKNSMSIPAIYSIGLLILYSLSILFGWLMYKFIDSPSVRLINHYYKLFFSKAEEDAERRRELVSLDSWKRAAVQLGQGMTEFKLKQLFRPRLLRMAVLVVVSVVSMSLLLINIQ